MFSNQSPYQSYDTVNPQDTLLNRGERRQTSMPSNDHFYALPQLEGDDSFMQDNDDNDGKRKGPKDTDRAWTAWQ